MESREDELERLVSQYGEEFRRLIVSALAWAYENEPKWGLSTPLNKGEYIDDLVQHTIPADERKGNGES